MQKNVLRLKTWLSKNRTTLRLSASYLFVIMVMSLSFSYVFYYTSTHELGRFSPPPKFFRPLPLDDFGRYHSFFRERIEESSGHLLDRLILVNVITLLLGSWLSFILARLTLQPIEQALDAQFRFSADASHELRTPLAVLQAQNEVALRNPKLSLDKSKKMLSSNLAEIVRLQGLIENLLVLAREVDGKAIPLVSLPLSSVTSEAIGQYEELAKDKHISISHNVADGLMVMSDANSLTHILGVLLDNAIKYSKDNTSIKISAKRSGKHCYLAVTDEGEGISKKDLSHIFERFYRADPSRSKQNVSGYGLGLSLADKIAGQINGQITAISSPGKGSTFTVKLPLA